LAKAVLKYFKDPQLTAQVKQSFTEMHQTLRRNASQTAANAILELVTS